MVVKAAKEKREMKKWILAVFVIFTSMLNAQGEPVLLTDNVLNLGDAIVVEGNQTKYYQHVQLELTKDGSFRVLSGFEKSLAAVTEESVEISETSPIKVQLKVSGYMSSPCIELETATTRKGSTFFVVVGETPLQTLVACEQMTKPFALEVPLDVSGLAGGNYVVMVNGDSIEFELD